MRNYTLKNEELLQRRALLLKDKVDLSCEKIEQWYNHWDGKVFVSFSGGKDSTVLLDIVRNRSFLPDAKNIPAVFFDTGLEFPEIRAFVKTKENVIWMKPKYSYGKIIEKAGYPVISKRESAKIALIRSANNPEKKKKYIGDAFYQLRKENEYLLDAPFKISDKCCYYFKKTLAKKAVRDLKSYPFIGVLATDDVLRYRVYMKYGCNAYTKKEPSSIPLAFWTEKDIWEYIRTYNIPYSSIYDKGYERTGCMFCMFGVQNETEPNRFQIMEITHPKIHKYCIEKLKLGEIMDYMNLPYSSKNKVSNMGNIKFSQMIENTKEEIKQTLENFSDKNIRLLYSGGSSSDILLHLLKNEGYNIPSLFFDNGIESNATYEHINNMKNKGFNIEIIKTKKDVSYYANKNGVSFGGYYVSDMIERLQDHGFDIEKDGNDNYESLLKKYPLATIAIKWWCNENSEHLSIRHFNFLKEFILENGLPKFKVSSSCCVFHKNRNIRQYVNNNNIDLVIKGLRKENSNRGNKNLVQKNGYIEYYPIYLWEENTKEFFKKENSIEYSRYYEEYKLPRTDCVGCLNAYPLDKTELLTTIKEKEPEFFEKIWTVFGEANLYEKQYREFRTEKEKQLFKQLALESKNSLDKSSDL